MENMQIYNATKACPDNALKPIQAGKLKGKSDINPIWRIKTLTEQFGPCGIGWKEDNVKFWTEPGADGEVSAWCSLELKIKVDGQWSEGIFGVGGSMLVNTEKGKLVTNDEAFKMAKTDALSVACKLLGFAADVYWNADRTKYDSASNPAPNQGSKNPPQPREPLPFPNGNNNPSQPQEPVHYCEDCTLPIKGLRRQDGTVITPAEFAAQTKALYGRQLCRECQKKAAAAMAESGS